VQFDPLDIGLFVIVLIVLVGPFMVKKIEHNLEAFLFVMGVLAVTISSFYSKEALEALGYSEHQMELIGWNMEIVMEAVKEPIIKGIVPAVLVAGLRFTMAGLCPEGNELSDPGGSCEDNCVFNCSHPRTVLKHNYCDHRISTAGRAHELHAIRAPNQDQSHHNRLFLHRFRCSSDPVGEPLSTIAITKLQGEPYNAGFFFLFNQLAIYIIPGCLAMGLLAMFFTGKAKAMECKVSEEEDGGLKDVVVRAIKVYIFVMALLLLGAGMKVVIDKYMLGISPQILYWVNMISAILDNATLTAAELSPAMSMTQIQAVLMGLLISGGMLIPGNIPNIISAGKLGISSKEWAKLGVPLGLILMAVYFVWIFFIPFHIEFHL